MRRESIILLFWLTAMRVVSAQEALLPGAIPEGLFIATSLNERDLRGKASVSLKVRRDPKTGGYEMIGTTGCNTVGGPLHFEPDGKIGAKQMVVTARACLDGDRRQMEKEYLALLVGMIRWRREGPILIIESDTGAARFEPAPG